MLSRHLPLFPEPPQTLRVNHLQATMPIIATLDHGTFPAPAELFNRIEQGWNTRGYWKYPHAAEALKWLHG